MTGSFVSCHSIDPVLHPGFGYGNIFRLPENDPKHRLPGVHGDFGVRREARLLVHWSWDHSKHTDTHTHAYLHFLKNCRKVQTFQSSNVDPQCLPGLSQPDILPTWLLWGPQREHGVARLTLMPQLGRVISWTVMKSAGSLGQGCKIKIMNLPLWLVKIWKNSRGIMVFKLNMFTFSKIIIKTSKTCIHPFGADLWLQCAASGEQIAWPDATNWWTLAGYQRFLPTLETTPKSFGCTGRHL